MKLLGTLRLCIRVNLGRELLINSGRCISTSGIICLPRRMVFRRPIMDTSIGPNASKVRPRAEHDQNVDDNEHSNSEILTENVLKHEESDTIYNNELYDKKTQRKRTNQKKNTNNNNVKEKSVLETAKAAALDVRRKLQSEAGVSRKKNNFDSKGFKVYTHTVQDLKKLPAGLVTSILKSRVIFNEGDILAIDKPYGLPCHGGPRVVNNIEELLPRLARMLPGQQGGVTLHMVHRLDKETTGVMLLAKTEEMKRKLQAMFRNHEIMKKYWVITVGVPEPNKGIIDIPMIEKEVDGKHRMSLKPDIGAIYKGVWQKKSRSLGTKSVSKFKVLDENGNSALVEVQAITGLKHQVRCHMGFVLGCPILGDHKYSHFNKLAPQKLPNDMLKELRLRQAKVRTMPMHLHAHQVVIPNIYKGRNISISTRLPRFFSKNLSSLKLKV